MIRSVFAVSAYALIPKRTMSAAPMILFLLFDIKLIIEFFVILFVIAYFATLKVFSPLAVSTFTMYVPAALPARFAGVP